MVTYTGAPQRRTANAEIMQFVGMLVGAAVHFGSQALTSDDVVGDLNDLNEARNQQLPPGAEKLGDGGQPLDKDNKPLEMPAEWARAGATKFNEKGMPVDDHGNVVDVPRPPLSEAEVEKTLKKNGHAEDPNYVKMMTEFASLRPDQQQEKLRMMGIDTVSQNGKLNQKMQEFGKMGGDLGQGIDEREERDYVNGHLRDPERVFGQSNLRAKYSAQGAASVATRKG